MLPMSIVFVLLPVLGLVAAWLLAPRTPAGEDSPLLRFEFVFAAFLLGADVGFLTAGLVADRRGLGAHAFGPVMLATLAAGGVAAILAELVFVHRLRTREHD